MGRFLAKRPVLCLLLLAPEVEYLTGSTQLSTLLLNPPIFFIFLGQNLGFYGVAVLLIREAKIRWKKGWASVLLLGAAYGIINEGIGAGTLFNPGAPNLGAYGHWLGVNWLNVVILIPVVHPLYSVTLPILLLDLALPETRGKSLLSSMALRWAFLVLAIDAAMTWFFVSSVLVHFYASPVLLVGSLAAIAALAWAARRVPASVLMARLSLPSSPPVRFALLGAGLPWVLFFVSGAMVAQGAPTVIVASVILILGAVSLLWVFRNIGRRENDMQKVALGAGLVAGLIPMGISSQLGTGLGLLAVLGGDAVAVVFFSYLWRRYRGQGASTGNTSFTSQS